MAILARHGSVNEVQKQSINEFYTSFRPGVLDARQFNAQRQMVQYLLLWFSAEVTGNDGSYFLITPKQHLPTKTLAPLQTQTVPIVEAERRQASRDDVDDGLR